MIKLQDKLLSESNKSMRVVYNKHKEDRDKLLSEISDILLDQELEEDRLVLSGKERKKLFISLNKTISDITLEEAIMEKDRIEDILLSAATEKYAINSYITSLGRSFSLNKLTRQQISSIVNQEVDGKLWGERIWANKRVLERKLRRDLTNLLNGATDISKIKKEVSREFKQNAYNSKRLVNNELARVQYEVNEEFARENQITKQMFVATLDDRTSEECESYDGQVFDLDDSSKPDIPVHVNCRCTYVNIVDDWTPTKRKDNITKEVGNWSSYKKWLSDQ